MKVKVFVLAFLVLAAQGLVCAKAQGAELVLKNGFGINTEVLYHSDMKTAVSFINPAVAIYGAAASWYKIGAGASLGLFKDRADEEKFFGAVYLSNKILFHKGEFDHKIYELYLLGELGLSWIRGDKDGICFGAGVSGVSETGILVEMLYQSYAVGTYNRIALNLGYKFDL